MKIVVLEFIEIAMPRLLLDEGRNQAWWPARVTDEALQRTAAREAAAHR